MRQAKKNINELKYITGDIMCEQRKLIKEIKRYYEQLSGTKKTNIESLENYILSTKIENEMNENDKLACHGKVTV